MRKLLSVFFLAGLFTSGVFGQGELDQQQKIFLRNERSFAILLNSDGYGLSYREAKRIDFLNKRFFEIEAGILKHSREYRESNPPFPGMFVYGKLNSVFYVRGSYGHQHELFKKADLGGVAVRIFYEGGPTFAIYKPIYYKILYPRSVNLTEFDIKEEKLDVNVHPPSDIYSRSSFTKGLNETKVLPGLFVKSGFNFEYSKEDKVIHAVELGVSLSAFPKKIPIMATADNKAIYFSMFVSYRFGVIIDPLNPETNKLSYIFRRKSRTTTAPSNY